MIARKNIELDCNHRIVGAASLNRLRYETYDIYQGNCVLRKNFPHVVGTVGEQAYATNNTNYLEHPFLYLTDAHFYAQLQTSLRLEKR